MSRPAIPFVIAALSVWLAACGGEPEPELKPWTPISPGSGEVPPPQTPEETSPAPKPPVSFQPPSGTSTASPGRQIGFNGAPLDSQGLAALAQLERTFGVIVPDGQYWYDSRSGWWGIWGGPALGQVPAGLLLGGALPAEASGGGTGVFINGRELHPSGVAQLQQITAVIPGRHWLDAQGNGGVEGGPQTFNLRQLAQQRFGTQGPGGTWGHATDLPGGNLYIGGDSSFTYFTGPDGEAVYIDH